MRGFVCYLERAAAGAAIRRARLLGPEVDRTWTAPDPDQENPGPGGTPPPDLVANTRAAAAWVAAELDGVRKIVALCVDTDGGVCAWLSSPSADPAILSAALRQTSNGSAGWTSTESSSAGSGLGLAPDAGIAFGSGRSLQALAPVEEPASTARNLMARLSREKPGTSPGPAGARRRLAVLSVPDASVRVFLDELDKHKIEVGSVMSLWHALAAAWNPPANAAPPSDDPRIVADAPSSSMAAVIMIDPLGRLVWAWSQDGLLGAAGSIRLRILPAQRPVEASAPPPLDADPGDFGSSALQGARRVPTPETAPGLQAIADEPILECAQADVGRLIMDWLSWSAQLGHTPDRIVCIGPTTVSSRSRVDPIAAPEVLPAPPAVQVSVPEALSQAWPGAVIDAAIHDDPVGATLNRLRGWTGDSRDAQAAPRALDVGQNDARSALLELTRRPGRIDRHLYRWLALAITAAAAAILVVGWRLNSLAAISRETARQTAQEKRDLLKSVDSLIPGVSSRAYPLGELSTKLVQLKDQRSKISRSSPVLAEVTRVLEAMRDLDALRIVDVNISADLASAKVNLPADDTESGQFLLDRAGSMPGSITWTGSEGVRHDDRRDYNLLGHWKPRPGETPAAPGGGI